MEVILLGLVAAGGLYYVSVLSVPTAPPDGTVKYPSSLSKSNMFDFSETGLQYNAAKPLSLQSTSLNDAFAPYASPLTTPTHSIPQVFEAMADNAAEVESRWPNWILEHWLEIPLTRAQQATANIEIPGPMGFKGGHTLVNYPRVYMDSANDNQFTNRKLLGVSGMPTENEIKSVYSSNVISREHNPYAGGAVFQRLVGEKDAVKAIRRGPRLDNKPNIVNFSR